MSETNESVATKESTATLTTVSRSDLDKNDPEESSSHSAEEPSSSSSSKKTMGKASDAVMKKRADSIDVHPKPGTNKARPIPELPGQDIPKDPDKDSPNVIVSTEHINDFCFTFILY